MTINPDNLNTVGYFSLYLNFVHLLAQKPNLEKIMFIQANSVVIVVCSNPVLLVSGLGQVG